MKKSTVNNINSINEKITSLKQKQTMLAHELNQQLEHLKQNSKPMLINSLFNASRKNEKKSEKSDKYERVNDLLGRFGDRVINKIEDLVFGKKDKT